MLGLRLMSITPRAALLARDRARSDDPEMDDGPDPVRPPAELPIHPFTGKFSDSELTVAYRSKAFRMMMPLHIVAMALMIGTTLFIFVSAVSTGNAGPDVVAPGVAMTASCSRPRCPNCSAPLGGPRQGPTCWSDGLDVDRRIGHCY